MKIFILVFLISIGMTTRTFSQKHIEKKNKDVKRSISKQIRNDFLVVSDVHLTDITSQMEADKDKNSTRLLWGQALVGIRKALKSDTNIKFVLFTGDANQHNHPETAERCNKEILNSLKALNLPVIFIPGNNDSKIDDYDKGYGTIVNDCATYNTNTFPQDIKCNTAQWDCYSCVFKRQLKIIGLNSNVFAAKHYDLSAATGILSWLSKELSDTSCEQILITMHMPPGFDYHKNELWYSATDQNNFLSMVASNQNRIIGLIGSHSHMDGYRLLYSNPKEGKDSVTAVLISAPGITPGHGNNPAFKIVSCDQAWKMLDFKTFYMPYHANNKITDFSLSDSLTHYYLIGDKGIKNFFKADPKVSSNYGNLYYITGNNNIADSIQTTIMVKFRKE